jgi:hypothetical protein
MGTLYMMQNYPAGTAGPSPGQTTSATLFTQLQVQTGASATYVMRVVEWGVSFNASAVGVPFQCDLVDTISINASVTGFAAADVSVLNPDTPAQSGTTSGAPFILSGTASGYLSTGEGTITSIRSFDCQMVEPIGGYYKQFPLGREPLITPGHFLRVRVHGDGTTKCIAYVIVEV